MDIPPPHVIVQTQDANGVLCDGYYDLPVTVPAYIALVTDGSPVATREANRLRGELRRQITSLPGARLEAVRLPCGTCPAYREEFDCTAIDRSTSRNVLVFLSGGVEPPEHARVRISAKAPHVLVLHAPGTPPPSVPWATPTTNAVTWDSHATEFVPQILASAGLTDPDARVFVSYRRKEAGELAEQLFDALGKRNFDVFVDRFRIRVGADFQQRILQELAHKSMVVYLESPGILDSEWTRYEIAVAKSARMGVLALHLDGGTTIRDIDATRRMQLSSKGGALPASELQQVIERIATEHSVSQLRRRWLLRENMQRALRLTGVFAQSVNDGTIVVEPNDGSSKRYMVWLPSRPADLADFFVAATKSAIGRRPVRTVIAPAAHLVGDERRRMRWLARAADVLAFDESHMFQVARAMKQELL